ncbi:PAS domain S-box protein [Haloplanus salilacus]|uniref:PAS domain S-box protein n=1 Tax=Haloplanus salilacus TaxID=2949994 RepID=UPI0030CAEA88
MPDTIDVLLVDDASDLTAVAAEVLGREDSRLEVATETDPKRGLARLEEGSFDCLITDYRMPGMDGLELLRAVRERRPDFPVILFTGEGDEATASQAISAGATDYVRKSHGTEQYALLANRIVRAVSKRRNRERADRLERIRELARDVNRSLVRADSAEAVERSVCERLVESDPYAGAMIGADGAVRSEAVTPAGDGDVAWKSAVAWDADGVATTAVTGGAVVTVPLAHVEGTYGVLSVRAVAPGAIGDPERELLEELGTDVASALHRIEMQTDLRESEAKYRRLVEQNLVGVYIIQDGEFEYVNPRLAAMFGYTQEEMRSDVTPFDVVVEDGRETLRENLRRRESGEVEDLRYTLRGERKDGSEIKFEVHGGRIEYGGDPAIMGTLLDVTKRRRQERELERSRAEYRDLFESIPDAVFVGREDTGFVAVNETAVDRLGYDREELLSMHPADIDPEMDATDVAEGVDSFSRDRITTFETVHRTKSGEEMPVEINATLITYQGEAAILSTARDITERVERERELERQNERLEQVASVVSHDLRNPLNVASGRIEGMRRECDSPHVEAVATALDRMANLIDDLLTLTGRRSDVDTEPVALDAVVEGCWANVVTGSATLRCEADGVIVADRSRLQQVFENLFRNSVEHGSTDNRHAERAGDSVEHGSTESRTGSDDGVEHGGSDLTVTVGDLDDGFYVEDDGLGIAPEEREGIFEAGYTTKANGTGLGLAIVGEVVEAHGWEVDVGLGSDGGARFEITGVTPVG